LFLIAFTGVSCSSLSDKLDIAGVIDSTENWLFGEENNKNEEELKNSNEENNSEEINIEEAFPDIAKIPQDRPDFEELDQSFFEEDQVNEEIKTKELLVSVKEYKEKEDLEGLSVEKKNILAVLKIRKNIRFNLVELLINSDPLVDKSVGLIGNKDILEIGDKKAIIQFPENSVIPDQSAYEVIEQIIKIIGVNEKIKLIGHASRSVSDNIASKRNNMEISIARAETIKNIFINKGFSANRMFASGKGDLEPLQDESKKYGEAINRRVEIFFISK
jgi:outer membrane protein OmpA-like peptidoglycan-associated protein